MARSGYPGKPAFGERPRKPRRILKRLAMARAWSWYIHHYTSDIIWSKVAKISFPVGHTASIDAAGWANDIGSRGLNFTHSNVSQTVPARIWCNVGKTIMNHPILDGLYHPFMDFMVIWGMVYEFNYCFDHINTYPSISHGWKHPDFSKHRNHRPQLDEKLPWSDIHVRSINP